MSRSKDIAEILGLTEAENTTNASLGDGSGGGSVTTYATPENLPTSGNESGDQAFVSSNNRLYIWNGSGWYNIALVNTNPSFSSSPDGSYELSSEGTATVITLVATDPEGVPITYTTTTDAGFDGLATVSNDSSVFTITPLSADSATTTSGNLTFKASDGVNLASAVSEFTLALSIENSASTALLAKASGNAGTNAALPTDNSSNNYTVASGGSTTPINASLTPFHPGGYSVYFDGTGDYLTVAQSDDFTLSGEFTVEMWVYLDQTSYARTIQRLVTSANTGYSAEPYISIGNDAGGVNAGCLCFSSSVGAGNPQGYATTEGTGATGTNLYFPFKQWVHVALTRDSSNVCRLFQDGNIVATVTISGGFDFNGAGNNGLSIAKSGWATTEYFGPGYIRDLRIVKGTSVYTANFTPPAAALTAITNTTLLACHLPYLADGSSNDHSITAYGNTSTKRFGPYDYLAYSASTHGSSVHLDGTGDYLTTTSSDYNLGTGSAFTIEFWYYFDESRTHTVFDFYNSSSGNVAKLAFTSGNVYLYDGSANILALTRAQNVGVWEHFCWTRDASNNHTFYINGSQVATSTATTSIDAHVVDFGRRAGSYNNTFMKGYLSDIRIVKGTAVYTSAFTPPTQRLTAITNTGMLLTASPSVYNAAGGGGFALAGTAQSSTTQTKNASSSILLDGNSDYITIDSESAWASSTDQFEIEFWMYPKSISGQTRSIFNFTDTQGSLDVLLYISSSSNILLYDGGEITSDSGGGITVNTWHHVVVSRATDNKIRIYLDGQLHATSSSTFTAALGRYLDIGYYGDSRYFDGHIEDFRVTKGFTRHPFIPTQETLTADTNTVLLTCHDSSVTTAASGTGATTSNLSTTGDPTATTGPVSNMSAVDFDGNDNLVIPNGNTDLGAINGAFTIEGWVNFDAAPPGTGSGNERHIVGQSSWPESSSGDWWVVYAVSTGIYWYAAGGGGYLLTQFPTFTWETGKWYHFALTRDASDAMGLFINGAYLAPTSNATNGKGILTTNGRAFSIGADDNASHNAVDGKISNLRISNVVRYTDTFTPPTSELTG